MGGGEYEYEVANTNIFANINEYDIFMFLFTPNLTYLSFFYFGVL